MEVRPDPITSLTATTSEQRAAAIEWLDRTGPYAHWAPFTPESAEHRDTIKAMLAEPRMPEEPTPNLIQVMRDHQPHYNAKGAYLALRAELLKDHGREGMAAGGKSPHIGTSSPNCTPAAREPTSALAWLERTGAFAHWHPWSEDSKPYRATIKAALTKMMAGPPVVTVSEALRVVAFYRNECRVMRERFKPEAPEFSMYRAAEAAALEIEGRIRTGTNRVPLASS